MEVHGEAGEVSLRSRVCYPRPSLPYVVPTITTEPWVIDRARGYAPTLSRLYSLGELAPLAPPGGQRACDGVAMDKAADLADLVQSMRKLMWKSAFLARDDEEGWLAVASVEWKRPATLRAAADRMRPSRPDLASEWEFLADALTAGPRVPTEDDLVRRYVRGEIGDRTVRWITS